MNKNQKITLWVIIAVIVVAAAIGIGYHYYHKHQVADQEMMSGTTPIATDSTSTDGDNAAAGGTTPATGLVSDVTAASLSYAQAVTIFANSRIQFDENCRMTPTTLATKNGTTIMFDNRYRNERTFKLDGVRYTLPGYGYKLFELTAGHVPHNIDVDCGTNQNSGKIDLE
jgi:hypothetical protein